MLTGDTLFVGDIARPDLAVDKSEGAHDIFRSLHEKLLQLPDTCEVWPGHLGGSLCGGPGMDLKVSSTIGFERAHSPMLQIGDEDEFVEKAISGLPPQPPNFQNIVARNRGPLEVEAVDIHPLTPRQVEQAQQDGALIVDVRTELQYDDAHVPRSVCITALRAGFGSKLAWIADHAQSVVLVGRDDDDAGTRRSSPRPSASRTSAASSRAASRAGARSGCSVKRIPRMTVDELHDQRDGLQILDVREQAEWERGHIPGSVHMPYHDIEGVAGRHRRRPSRSRSSAARASARPSPAGLLEMHGVEAARARGGRRRRHVEAPRMANRDVETLRAAGLRRR